MTKFHNTVLYFVSLFLTLLLFAFLTLFLVVGTRGIRDTEELFSVTQTDPLHTQVEWLGSSLEFDYTPLQEAERIRRKFAPLLTPRALLTAEYALEYAAHWGDVLYASLEEYLFMQEAYGPDVVKVSGPVTELGNHKEGAPE